MSSMSSLFRSHWPRLPESFLSSSAPSGSGPSGSLQSVDVTSLVFDVEHLVAALPIGAAFVVAARTVFGVRTIGVFAPALLALGVLATGIVRGMAIVFLALVVGFVASPIVHRLAMPRVARLGLVLSIVCGALMSSGLAASEQAALPLLTISVLIERCWDTITVEGVRAGMHTLWVTATLATVIAAALASPPVQALVGRHPGLAVLCGGVLIVVAGSFRGLRIGERRRFRSLVVEAA